MHGLVLQQQGAAMVHMCSLLQASLGSNPQ
jgi:hypothetical protein